MRSFQIANPGLVSQQDLTTIINRASKFIFSLSFVCLLLSVSLSTSLSGFQMDSDGSLPGEDPMENGEGCGEH